MPSDFILFSDNIVEMNCWIKYLLPNLDGMFHNGMDPYATLSVVLHVP